MICTEHCNEFRDHREYFWFSNRLKGAISINEQRLEI
jgi:hypothetical protein